MQEGLFGNNATAQVDALLRELWKTDGWPKDEPRDRALIAELVQQYPTLDLTDEFSKFRTWLIAKGTGKEVKSRGRFQRLRNWCSRAGAGNARSPVATTRNGKRRTSTAARPVEAFGDESSQSLTRW